MGGHLIATYCRFNSDRSDATDDYTKFPPYVLNRIRKTHETFVRLTRSHADDEFIKIAFFGREASTLKAYALSIGLPENRIELDTDCASIENMVRKIWDGMKNDANPPRIYFVLSNWQWIFIEPLLKLKSDHFKFYFEGALDERLPQVIEAEKKFEKTAKINLKEAKMDKVFDTVGSGISENLKG